MKRGALGRTYRDGELIMRQGEKGDCMYVILEGEVEILDERDGRKIPLRVAGENELIGEMSVFEKEERSATARARGAARLLTLDKKNFMRRINEDPTLAFRIIETMSRRVRELSRQIAQLKNEKSG